MNKQKTDFRKPKQDRTWRQTGSSVIIEHNQDEPVSEEWLAGQVSQVTASLADGNPLNLPELILKKIEASIIQAVTGVFAGDSGKIQHSPALWVVQVRTFVRDLAAQSKAIGLPDDRWGFFIVQKQGDQPGSAQLFLDLYLYQE